MPWNADTLRPLFEQVVPALEKLDVAKLVELAADLGEPALVKAVEKDAPWNPAAKAGLIGAGPLCAAELLNDTGIGADKAHWVAFILAGGSILAGRQLLAAKLSRMKADKKLPPTPAPTPAPAP